ncbi:Por secretion system C-terminal sorting domain-containing protein [Hymenobacter daecheongensis DSM 21074]|uniref:Por secretion system C-terminal sorting domain-containing protein n=1 Tax=Hymenobacter daecheongensis DSM 21074 TaxID=1121955 RepID=A0A1M6GKA2_9BACT|nr:zinc-dependent metalloprotease family protein [Hymenobacter daecheongensis]SHJ10349.1 Por secretion system C-terminal sorting domain-containing protein [Hymenobacter daecheongensis DSM 21074]
MISSFTKAVRTWQPALLGGLLFAAAGAPHSATAQRVLWADDAQTAPAARQTMARISQYRPISVQLEAMRATLAQAPTEQGAGARNSATVVSLPMPDGTSQRFRVVEVPVMAPALAAKYPSIKTYAAQGIDNPAATARLDVTPAGFHAMIMQAGRTVYIDPTANGDTEHYVVFDKQAMNQKGFTCLNTDAQDVGVPQPATLPRVPNGTQLRTYRMALACTGEYAAAVCAPAAATVPLTLAKMVTSVNRVDGVYEQEVAVRLVLVANTDQLIYLNGSSDPYTNNSGSAMLTQNISTVNSIIGFSNYDIGHVFSTGGGGVAYKPSVCLTNKAGGVTGLPNPVGDAFDIDYVAHEVGHQFGGDHTFNSSTGNCAGGNRAATSAYEPGSGVSIMAYAGICAPQDLANNSIPYFHSRSFDQIVAHITGAGNCGVVTATNNVVPVVNAGANYAIPYRTPFTLTGSATDTDPLTYSWEQYNLGAAGSPSVPVGDAPIFRMYSPTASPSRTFPKIYNLITNTDTIGEQLPTYARKLIFRLVARDNRVNGGGVDYDSMNVAVVSTAGPFVATYPNTSGSIISWLAGTPQEVRWDVANTTAAPVNAANVDIMLSTDGGRTYPTTLLANTPNDGVQTLTLPATLASSSTARIKVQASGNIFFDISNQNFSLRAATAPTFFLTPSVAGNAALPNVCAGSTTTFNVAVGQLQGFSGAVALSAANLPTGLTVSYANATVNTGSSTQVTVTASAATASGTYVINLVGTSGSVTQTQPMQIVVRQASTVAPAPVGPVGPNRTSTRPRFTWNALADAVSYEVQVATDAAFTNIVLTQANIIGTGFTPTTALTANATYFWRVRAVSPCGTTPFSAATQFQTGLEVCNTIVATQVPRVILPSANASVTSIINVASSDRVVGVRLRNLAINHPDVSELEISLTNPAGRSVVLFSRACPGTSNLSLSFDDAAAAALACPLTTGTTYRPANPLAALITDQPNGSWTLRITDNTAGNGGTLTGWSLELCTIGDVPAAPSSLSVLPGTFTNGGTENVILWADNSGNETSFQLERSFNTNTNFQLVSTTGANETNTVDRVTTSGRYYYRVRACNAIGCSAYTTEATVLSNRNTELLKGIEVYPNPSTGIFKVNVDNGQRGNITLRVTDALGRTVATETLVKGAAALQHSLDLSKLNTGVYQLHLDLPNGTAVTRLMKQ